MVKAKNKTNTNRTVIMRLLLTQSERKILEKLAYEQAGGNMSEYVRRALFPKTRKTGANDEQHQDSAA